MHVELSMLSTDVVIEVSMPLREELCIRAIATGWQPEGFRVPEVTKIPHPDSQIVNVGSQKKKIASFLARDKSPNTVQDPCVNVVGKPVAKSMDGILCLQPAH